jgi:hypothetical protein
LILQRIADAPDQEARDVVIDVRVLAAKRGYGHGYGRLHGAEAIRHLFEARGGALDL